MAEVRRRSTSSGGTKTASRRRDRVAEETDDDDEDEDATPPRKPRGTAAKSTTARRRPVEVDEDDDDDDDEEEPPPVRKKRRPAPEPEDDDEDDDEDEDEDEDEEPPPPRKKRRPAPVEETDDDDEDDDEDEEPPRRTRSRSAKKTTARAKAARTKLPPGVRAGLAGVEATAKAGGGGEGRITLDKTPILVKILQPEPLVSFRQHWLSQGKGQGQRAYTCMGKPECPVCKYGDRAAMSVVLNVLNLSVEGEPRNEYLQIGKRAWDSLSEQSGGDLQKLFWSVNKTGKGTSSQTNFRPVKQRDIKEDWPEVLEDIDLRDIPAAIEEAKENLFTIDDVVQVHTRKQLLEVSKYLADDEDDDDDDDDEDDDD